MCLSREFPCLRSFFWPRSLLRWDSLDGRKLSSCWWAFWKCGCEKSIFFIYLLAAPPLNLDTTKQACFERANPFGVGLTEMFLFLARGERASGATPAGQKFLPSDSDSSRNVHASVATISAQVQHEIIVSKAEMPLVSEFVHPKGLSLAAQRKVVFLREIKGLAYQKIAERVRNLQGNRPSKEHVREVCQAFRSPTARKKYKYSKCGRKPWKVTKVVKVFRRSARARRKCCATFSQKIAQARAGTMPNQNPLPRRLLHRVQKIVFDGGVNSFPLAWPI